MTNKTSKWQRYKILSSYDGAVIARQLGEHYPDLAEIHRAATEAYNQLSSHEKAMDYWQASQELERLKRREQ